MIQDVSELRTNSLPIVRMRSPSSAVVEVEDNLLFLGISSFDTDGEIVLASWEFGDGTMDTSTTLRSRHAFASPGTYAVTMTAYDNQ